MKKIIIIAITLAIGQSYAQTELTNSPDYGGMVKPATGTNPNTDIVDSASLDVQPEFPGGMRAFQMFIASNITIPDVPELKEDTVVRGHVTFVVERDGSVSDVKAMRDPGYGLREQMVSALKKSPKWKPGQQNGKSVRTRYVLPLTFNIPGSGETETEKENAIKKQ